MNNPKRLSVTLVAVLMVLAAGCTAAGFTTDTGADANAQLQQNGQAAESNSTQSNATATNETTETTTTNSTGDSPTEIDSCTGISEPGRYVLTADIENTTTDQCIQILSPNVTFDGAGHTIDGVDDFPTSGIVVFGSDGAYNVTVSNVTVTDWGDGIAYETSSGAIRNSVVASNSRGITFTFGTGGVTVQNTTARGNDFAGFYVQDSPSNRFVNDTASDNGFAYASRSDPTEGLSVNDTVKNLALDSATVSFESKDIKLGAVESPPASPDGLTNVGGYVNVTNNSDFRESFIDLTVHYTDDEVAGVNEDSLRLYAYSNGTWSPVPESTVDTDANTVSANVTALGGAGNPTILAPFGEPVAASTETPEQTGEDTGPTAIEPLDRPNATRIQENASIVFNDQTSDGSSVTVSRVTFDNGSLGAVVAIYNEQNIRIGGTFLPESGTHRNVTVDIEQTIRADENTIAPLGIPLNESQTLTARLVDLDIRQYRHENGSVVADTANITIADAEGDTVEPTPNEQPAEEGVAYYQVDFVVGEPIENLRGPEGTYSNDQLIRFLHGSSEEPVMRRAPGAFAYAENNVAERIESHEITVENGTATVTFTVTEGKPVELSLVSYTKPGPGWSPATEAEQEFVDADTDTFGPGTYTLTVSLPSSENVTDANQTATETSDSGEGKLSIAGLSADADGNDNNNLNDEYIVYENTGNSSLNLSGWTVTDSSGTTFTFPDGFTLSPGEQVTLYTGSGTSTDSALYWGQATEVWNNGADTMTVRNASGEIVIQQSYP
ncbi:MAG TPA: lamin tail domain-containing protein [Halococcus sp.]|nr:lamin tail domain-containing protein [Halococcus sp.]